jgi:hypothetical protein
VTAVEKRGVMATFNRPEFALALVEMPCSGHTGRGQARQTDTHCAVPPGTARRRRPRRPLGPWMRGTAERRPGECSGPVIIRAAWHRPRCRVPVSPPRLRS